jgi:DNA-binding transcriptional MerR regulator
MITKPTLNLDIDVRVKGVAAGMRIGELSARTGATERMLRYYEENGLLDPGRTAAGYRVYAESDIQRVRHIRCMLASALPTHVVRQAIAFLIDGAPQVPGTPAERARLADVLGDELAALEERIAVLNQSHANLARFVGDIRAELVGPQRRESIDDTDYGPAVAQGVPMKRRREPRRVTAA